MAVFQYTRFENIYDNRDLAINLLNNLIRSYAETIAVKYYQGNEICLILAVYKSDNKGDYDIVHDTKISNREPIVYTTKRVELQTDEDCIKTALFGKTPLAGDYVVINESNNGITSFIYTNKWVKISESVAGGEGGGRLDVEDTNTVDLEISSYSGKLKANVKIDNETLKYSPETKSIRVNKIYGGTF